MTRTNPWVLAAILLFWATSPERIAGQDEEGARAAVAQIFGGMRTANSDMVRDVFAADARFAILDEGHGTTIVRVQSVDGWISSIGSSAGRWNEQVYDLDIHVDGKMASIWAPYTFYLDGGLRHCGTNSIELLHDTDGWKVTQLSDTRRTDNCPDPLGLGESVAGAGGTVISPRGSSQSA